MEISPRHFVPVSLAEIRKKKGTDFSVRMKPIDNFF
jgi:hypothetical protein